VGHFENLYSKREEDKRLAEEQRGIAIWNHEVDIIKEIIGEIIKRAKNQNPEECDWITGNTLVTAKDGRCVSWNMFSWKHDSGVGHINLLPDGRLIVLYDYRFKPSKNDYILELGHIDGLSCLQPKGFNDLGWFELRKLRERMIHNAQNYFGVTAKSTWLDISQ